MIRLFRALLFWFGLALLTIPFGLMSIPLWLFQIPFRHRFAILRHWGRFSVRWLRLCCGVDWVVEGREHIPSDAGLLFSNHQSTWETLFLQELFHPQVWVLKKSLLKIPFFGWGLRSLDPIAIDRGQGRQAIRQIIDQGPALLEDGRWILIFPEGTRLHPGETRRWGSGGAALAAASGYPISPVAHDAGRFWPRGGFLPRPGRITVRVGPRIDTVGKSADTINTEVRAWIEGNRPDLNP